MSGARGISLPVRPEKGRMKKLGGDKYIEQLIDTMLGDLESDNPFQDLALGEFMIFALNDERIEGEIRKRVELGFRSLKRDQLAQLSSRTKSISFSQDGAVKKMKVKYQNLETGERREHEVPLPSAGEE